MLHSKWEKSILTSYEEKVETFNFLDILSLEFVCIPG